MENSIEGLWIVWYEDVSGDGRGVAVLTSGRLLGGESAWYYDGSYSTEGSEFSAQVTLTHFGKPTSKSVVGHLPGQSPVRLDVSGRRTSADTIEAKAVPDGGGEPTQFQFRRVA